VVDDAGACAAAVAGFGAGVEMHGKLAWHGGGPATQTPSAHVSAPVQKAPSLQSASPLHGRLSTIQAGGVPGWTAQNSLPVALKDPAVVIGTNTIYVMGGRDASQIYNTIYYAAINTDGSIGAWQASAVNLPVNLWGHTAVYNNGYIYVAGGSSSATENTAITNVYVAKVYANNTLSSFTAVTALPGARNKHSMVTYNSKLYVLGGYNNTGTKAATVYIATPGLDGNLGAWASGTSLPVAVSNHSSAVMNGLITVMAGDVGARSATPFITPMPMPVCSHGLPLRTLCTTLPRTDRPSRQTARSITPAERTFQIRPSTIAAMRTWY